MAMSFAGVTPHRLAASASRLPHWLPASIIVGALSVTALALALVAAGVLPPPLDAIAEAVAALVTIALAVAAWVLLIGGRSAKADRLGTMISAFEAVSIASFIVTTVDGCVWANRAATALLPLDVDPLDALRQRLLDADQRARLDLMRHEAVSGRQAAGRLILADSSERGQSIQLSGTPVPTHTGAVLWQVISVAERAVEPVALIDRDAQALFDSVPIGLFSLDGKGRFVTVNRTFADWLGSTPERMLADSAELEEVLVPEAPGTDGKVYEPFKPAAGVGVTLQSRNGRVFRVAVNQAVTRLGPNITTWAAARDIGSDDAVEDTVRLVRRRFQHFFESAPVGIALVDATGRITEANGVLEELLAGRGVSVAKRAVFEFIAAENHDELRARLRDAVAGHNEPKPLDLKLTLPRGDKSVAVFFSPLQGEHGGIVGAILHFIDLSEQKNLEIQFAQSQKMQAVGQLAGGVAHDFNNLLTAMIGFCDLLLLRFKPGDQSFADIMQIKQNANRAANLVRQLLAFSRQQTLQPRVLNISDVLTELSHLLNRLLGDNIELKMLRGADVGPVKVDQGQLEQVIINLAVNARDAMPNGGTLTLRTAGVESREPIRHELEEMPPGSWVLIEVTDDGLGIPREIIDRIFEPFFSTKEIGSGTGLGLSTVYGIVKQTGGYVFVESSVGIGTKFSIYLPRHIEVVPIGEPVAAPVAIESRPSSDLTGAGTILLVEDEDPVRLFSARALRNKGYNVLEARSGEAALQIIEEEEGPIDLIVTDVMMPRVDGPTLIRQVRLQMPDVKVIFISGYAEDTLRPRLDDDRTQFLAKPFSLKQLAEKVKEALADPA